MRDFETTLARAEGAVYGMPEEDIIDILKGVLDASPFDRNRVITTLAKQVKVSVPQMHQLFKDVTRPNMYTIIGQEGDKWFMEFVINGVSGYIYGPEEFVRAAQQSRTLLHALEALWSEG